MNPARRKGQPLFALVGVLALWVALRLAGPIDGALETPLPLPPTVAHRVAAAAPGDVTPVAPEVSDIAFTPLSNVEPPAAATKAPRPSLSPISRIVALPVSARSHPESGPMPPTPRAPRAPAPAPEPRRATAPRPVPFSAVPADRGETRRWSGDAWVMVREKARARSAGVGGGALGASQAGAVVRYRLSPGSRLEPRVHMRVTGALSGPTETEVAAGLGVTPLAQLPVEILVEGRVGRFADRTRVRPSALAVFGPPPLALPGEITAETYAQAGWVGGGGATAFIDGQVRASREVMRAGDVVVSAGGGAWGGAQRGASRVDIGPGIVASMPLGKGLYARAALDWRARVAGDAEPGSGPVFTLSAGF